VKKVALLIIATAVLTLGLTAPALASGERSRDELRGLSVVSATRCASPGLCTPFPNQWALFLAVFGNPNVNETQRAWH
jgi:hypothetical protein